MLKTEHRTIPGSMKPASTQPIGRMWLL